MIRKQRTLPFQQTLLIFASNYRNDLWTTESKLCVFDLNILKYPQIVIRNKISLV